MSRLPFIAYSNGILIVFGVAESYFSTITRQTKQSNYYSRCAKHQPWIDLGNPIRDISPTKGDGFLDLERNLLIQNGWKFAPVAGLWSP